MSMQEHGREFNPQPKRRGAKMLYAEVMPRVNVTADPETIRFLVELGGNNLSGGIRKAASILKRLQEDGKLDESLMKEAA